MVKDIHQHEDVKVIEPIKYNKAILWPTSYLQVFYSRRRKNPRKENLQIQNRGDTGRQFYWSISSKRLVDVLYLLTYDMPRPGLQRKGAAATLSQAGRAGPDQSICAIRPAGCTHRLPTGCTWQTSDVRQTDTRQHYRLMPPSRTYCRQLNLLNFGRGHHDNWQFPVTCKQN